MNFKEVCRTCLAPTESERSIFSSIQLENLEVIKLSILDLLKVFDISISPDNSLPDSICSDCLKKIQQSYAFKLKFDRAQSSLKHLKASENDESNLNEYEYYTEERIDLMKIEKIEHCYISNSEQQEAAFISDSEQDFTKQEISFVQQVKQEPEVEINMEEKDFNEEGTSTNKLQCATCSKFFRNRYRLVQHMRTHTGEKPFHCELCPNKYQFKGSLKEHMHRTHVVITPNNSKFTCVTCSQLFRHKYKLDEHMRIHTGEKPFKCEHCPKKYRLKGSLKEHIQNTHVTSSSTSHNATRPSTRMYKCTTCSKLFKRRDHMHQHMRIHTGEKPFQCELCPKNFRINQSFMKHLRTIHGDKIPNTKKFRCSTCFKLFRQKRKLAVHMRSHIGEKQFQCQVCTKKYRFKRNLTDHMQTTHADKTKSSTRINCAICSKLFLHKYTYDRHMIIHTGGKPFQCEVCPKKYRFRSNLLQHIQATHTDGSSKFKCTTCSKLFHQKYKLDRHMRMHTGERPFQCELCPNKYRLKGSLTAHIQIKHLQTTHMRPKHADANTRKFQCEICSKSFGQKYKIDQHMRLHTGEKPFHCELCPNKFRLKEGLTVHLQKAHADIIPNARKFECTTCSKIFEGKGRLDEHMRIHTGEKPFHCEVCPKKFRINRSLTEHVQRIHADITDNSVKFKCDVCSKLFERQSRLNEHMTLHTGELPFQCEVCLKKFRLRSSLRAHMNRTHADITAYTKKFKCETCSKLFECQTRLNEHIRIHTGEKPFECEVCSKTFRINRSLTEHMQKMHADSEPKGSKLVAHTGGEPLQSGV